MKMRKALFFLGILSDSDVEWMIGSGARRQVPAGTVLIEQGRSTDSLLFVLDGEFEVFTRKAPRLATLKAGEVIGEISFVDSRPATASVKARVASEVGVLPRRLLASKLKDDVAFAARFYQALAAFMADRLRTTVGHFGTGPLEVDDPVEELSVAAPHLTDNVSAGGTRFSEMQRKPWGGNRPG